MRVCLGDHVSEAKVCRSLLFLLHRWKVFMIESRSAFDLSLVTQVHASTALTLTLLLLFACLFIVQTNGAKERQEIWITEGCVYIWISLVQPPQSVHMMVDHKGLS